MVQTTSYTMQAVAVTVDGQLTHGFFEGDDAVMIAPGDDEGNMLIGSDGSALFSQFVDNSVVVTLKLQHTSPTHRLLMNKQAQQKAGRLTPFPVDIVETNSGEGGNGLFFVLRAPDKGYGKSASVREWKLVSADWRSS